MQDYENLHTSPRGNKIEAPSEDPEAIPSLNYVSLRHLAAKEITFCPDCKGKICTEDCPDRLEDGCKCHELESDDEE